jgi:hypothetical protein
VAWTFERFWFDELDLEEMSIKGAIIRHSSIESFLVGDGLTRSSLRIEDSIIGRVYGVPTAEGLPNGVFIGCDFGAFDDASTNAAVLRLDLPPSLKALMTILRKLYLQAGGGRKVAALRRGTTQWAGS